MLYFHNVCQFLEPYRKGIEDRLSCYYEVNNYTAFEVFLDDDYEDDEIRKDIDLIKKVWKIDEDTIWLEMY